MVLCGNRFVISSKSIESIINNRKNQTNHINQSNLTAGYYLAITYTLANDFTRAHSLADSLLKLLPNEQKIKDLQTFIATQERNTPNTSVIKK